MPFDPPADAKSGDDYVFAGRSYIAREDPAVRVPSDFPTKDEALAVFSAEVYRSENGDLASFTDAQLLQHFTDSGYKECKFFNSSTGLWESFPAYAHGTRCNYFWPDAEAESSNAPAETLLAALENFNADAFVADGQWEDQASFDAWYTANQSVAHNWTTHYPDVNFYSSTAGKTWADYGVTQISNLAEFKRAYFISHGFHRGASYKYATVWDNTGHRRNTQKAFSGGDWETPYDVEPEGFQLDIQVLSMDEGYNNDPYADDSGYFNGQLKVRIKYNSLLEDDDGNLRFGVSRDGGVKWTMFSPSADGVNLSFGYQEIMWDSLEAGVYQLYVIDLNRREMINIRPELKLCLGDGTLQGGTPAYNSQSGHQTAVISQMGGSRKCSSKSSSAGAQVWLDHTLLPAYALPPVTTSSATVSGHHPWHNYLITRINVSTSNASTVGSGISANQTFPDFSVQNCGMALALATGSQASVKVGDTCAISLYRDPAETGSTASDSFTKFWAGLSEKPAESSVPITPTSSQVVDANSCTYHPYHLNLIRGWCAELWDLLSEKERVEIIWHGWYWQEYFAGNLLPCTAEGSGEIYTYLKWNTTEGIGGGTQNPPIVYDYWAFTSSGLDGGHNFPTLGLDGSAMPTWTSWLGGSSMLNQNHKRNDTETPHSSFTVATNHNYDHRHLYGGNPGTLWFMLCDRTFGTMSTAAAGSSALLSAPEYAPKRWGPRITTTLPALPGNGWESDLNGPQSHQFKSGDFNNSYLYPAADWIHGATPATTYEEAPLLHDGVGAKYFSFSSPFSEEAEHGVDCRGASPEGNTDVSDGGPPSGRGCLGAEKEVNSWYSTSEGKSEIHLNPQGKGGQSRASQSTNPGSSESTYSGFTMNPPTNAEWGDHCDGHSGKRMRVGLGWSGDRPAYWKGLLPGPPATAAHWGPETLEGKEPIGNPGTNFTASSQIASNYFGHPDSNPLVDKYIPARHMAEWGDSAPSGNATTYGTGLHTWATTAAWNSMRATGHIFQEWPKYNQRNAPWVGTNFPDYLKKFGTAGAIAGKTSDGAGNFSNTVIAANHSGSINDWQSGWYWNNSKAAVSYGGFNPSLSGGSLITHPGTWPGSNATLINNFHFGKPFFYFRPDVPGLYKFRFEQDTAPQAGWNNAKLGEGCSSEYYLVVVD